ncbi:MAG: DUF6044 family protein [Lachnospiraceae bacterium]|nr:DUF6044 family protein [Lachnospiraceae bacterium]
MMVKENDLKTGLSKSIPGDGLKSHHPSCFAKWIFPLIGICLVIIGNLPFFILGEKCVIDVHEQLDGELVAYMLGGKYLFGGVSDYPEFLGGIPKAALTPPSYGTVLFYSILSPLYAYLVNQFFVMLISFVGMYLWLVRLTKKRFISFCSAVLFAFLPYFTVYGISVSGIPMVAFSFLVLSGIGKDSETVTHKIMYVLSFVMIAIYAVFSSFVLCGYAVCALYLVAAIILTVTSKKNKTDKFGIIRTWCGLVLLSGIYLIFNYNLILQIIKPETGFLSHKSEVVLSGGGFVNTFTELFIKGSSAVPSLHIFIFAISFFALIGFIAVKKVNKYYGCLITGVFLAALIAAFSGMMHTNKVVNALNASDSALKAFQIDRFYWLYPFIWYTVLALVGCMLTDGIKKFKIGLILFIVCLIPTAVYVLKESDFKENALEFVRKESTALTWEAFFCEDEFREVADYIKENYGLEQSEYRVGSLGIEPSVSFYNGFYTIDGYSNNYELSYKHKFRRVIEKELSKNSYNKDYFDNWGNRCYLLSSEYYGIRLMTKYEHAHYDDLELNTSALKDLGCRFILSAGEIKNAEDKGYKLCKAFDRSGYTYFIYLYEIL